MRCLALHERAQLYSAHLTPILLVGTSLTHFHKAELLQDRYHLSRLENRMLAHSQATTTV